ncbi:MAG: ATP-dependent Clp protease adaptor ClpS [Nitrospinae bacterium]|nr:ATP-dependent Clp protease adaptor ClpS [Nitrospinota bacterium]
MSGQRHEPAVRPLASPGEDAQTAGQDALGPLYWVVMHNDPVTTMDFVVMVLMKVFQLDYGKAVERMYRIHHNGLEYIELLPLERAEFKVEMVHRAARAQNFPLTCTVEPGK